MKYFRWMLLAILVGLFLAGCGGHRQQLPLLPELVAQQKQAPATVEEATVVTAPEESTQLLPLTITAADLKEVSEPATVKQPAAQTGQKPVTSSVEARLSAVEKTVAGHATLLASHEKKFVVYGKRLDRLEEYQAAIDRKLSGVDLNKVNQFRVGEFNTKSAAITQKMKIQLEGIFKKLDAEAKAKGAPIYIVIEGYASQSGKMEYNQKLSLARARAVAEFFSVYKKSDTVIVKVAVGKGVWNQYILDKNNQTCLIRVL
ncbi:MAG: OmpA family protein [Patescibacteria group bacterium]